MPAFLRRSASRHAAALALAALGVVVDARAHINLITPVPREEGPSREPNSNVKRGPCGQEANGRTDKVTVYEPGATVEVTWEETTNHRSYYRVAFDVDGDDAFPTFVGPGTGAEGIDPSGPCPIDGQVILAYDMDDRAGGSHTLQLRLPDVECERCTLQVVQFMYDARNPYYFQCADVALRRARPTDDEGLDASVTGASATDANSALTSNDAARPQAESPSAAPGCSSRIAPEEPSPSAGDDDDDDDRPAAVRPAPPSVAGDAPSMPLPVASRSDKGCSLAAERSGATSTHWLTLLGAWAIARARRRFAARMTA